MYIYVNICKYLLVLHIKLHRSGLQMPAAQSGRLPRASAPPLPVHRGARPGILQAAVVFTLRSRTNHYVNRTTLFPPSMPAAGDLVFSRPGCASDLKAGMDHWHDHDGPPAGSHVKTGQDIQSYHLKCILPNSIYQSFGCMTNFQCFLGHQLEGPS